MSVVKSNEEFVSSNRYFIIEYFFMNQLSFIGSALFMTEKGANEFAVKFCQSRPGHQFKVRPVYLTPDF